MLQCSTQGLTLFFAPNTECLFLVHDTYGEVYATGGSAQTVFGFTGEEKDLTELINLRARYYNPSLGQFFNLDPLETPNRYAYVAGNVVNRRDPSGLCGGDPCNLDDPKRDNTCWNLATELYSTYGVVIRKKVYESDGSLGGVGIVPTFIGQAWTLEELTYLKKALGRIADKFAFTGSDGAAIFRYHIGDKHPLIIKQVPLANQFPINIATKLLKGIDGSNAVTLGNTISVDPDYLTRSLELLDKQILPSLVPSIRQQADTFENFLLTTFVHELGHVLENNDGTLDDSFLQAVGGSCWGINCSGYFPGTENPATDEGYLNVHEDFATAWAQYIVGQPDLGGRWISPKRLNYFWGLTAKWIQSSNDVTQPFSTQEASRAFGCTSVVSMANLLTSC